MSFEQKRNAERLPLDEPLDATAGGVAVKIVELSAIGCRIEHRVKLPIGGGTTLRFAWRGTTIDVLAKISRTQLRSTGGTMMFESGLKFADSLETAPVELRRLLEAVAAPAVVPPSKDKVSTAEVPPIPEPPPATPGEDTLRRLQLGRESQLPLEAFAPVDEALAYDLASLDIDAPPTTMNPFTSQADAVALAVEPPPEKEEPQAEYVECRLEKGKWTRRTVTSILQPPEGFITVPADDRELEMLCKSYQYADPDTRRLIRISLELAATKK